MSSASPTVLAAIAASVTSRLRVGTAGVMLRYASPLKVAEDFRLLELLFPNRIDLGTISGREGHPLDSVLLDGRPYSSLEDYESKFERVMNLVLHGSSDGSEASMVAGPAPTSVPQVWVCGLHERSTRMAARLGARLAYHRFLARSSGETDGPRLVRTYQDQFRPDMHQREPIVAVLCVGSCGETTANAEDLWIGSGPSTSQSLADRALRGSVDHQHRDGGPDFLGSPEECRRQLEAVALEFGTTELVLHCGDVNLHSQIRQYARLAKAFGLTADDTIETASRQALSDS